MPLGIGSCVPRTLRTDQLERRLTREIVATTDVDDIRVDCPTGIEVRRGDTFVCIATAQNGDRLRIVVTQVDDEGAVTWEIAGSAE